MSTLNRSAQRGGLEEKGWHGKRKQTAYVKMKNCENQFLDFIESDLSVGSHVDAQRLAPAPAAPHLPRQDDLRAVQESVKAITLCFLIFGHFIKENGKG